MVWTAWLLMACTASDLRIDLPPKGLASLSQEDLRRDIWLAEQSAGNLDWYQLRMKQMGLYQYSSQARICVGERGKPQISILYEESKSGFLGMACQISLAKVQHDSGIKYSFCIFDDEIPAGDIHLGDMTGLIIQRTPAKIDTTLPQKDIHYRKVLSHLESIAKDLVLFSATQ